MKSTARQDAEGARRRVSGIRIGISACLLGQEVRFDGGHKKNPFLTEILAPHVEWVPVCPEVELGMGTPREALRLVRDKRRIRMVTTRSLIDHTDAMNAWARRRVAALTRADLDGYVLKKDSPSCGMERVKVYGNDGPGVRDGRGLFADALICRLPMLPVEEEGRLLDLRLRENFIERVFAYRRLKELFASKWSIGTLIRFHTVHKMSLLAHSTTAYQELGRLVADGAQLSKSELRTRYEKLFMTTLSIPATTRRHTNVLTHMAGHLKDKLDAASRQELAAAIEAYRQGLVPLVAPLTLISHHVRVHEVDYLTGQVYLQPHAVNP
jgi:uncharacterized protein YbgA (DUF1722 family)/uncharacterized protein YbbK (DUF523 family)